jgi:hypothetical protein
VALLLLAAIAVATVVGAGSVIRAVIPAPRTGQRILLAAGDAGGRLDGIAIVAVAENQVVLLAVPRDSVGPDGHRVNGLPTRMGGVSRAAESLAALLATPLDGHVILNYEQLAAVLEESFPQGLPVSHQAVKYRDSRQRLVISIPAGNHLGAREIAPYIRARLGVGDKSDLGRVRRALAVLRVAGAEFCRQRDLSGANRLLADLKQNCETDLSVADLRALAAAVMRFPVRVAVVPGQAGSDGTYRLDLPLARRMIKSAGTTGLPNPQVTVHIEVGTGAAAEFAPLASQATRLARQGGFARVGDVVATASPVRASLVEYGGAATRGDAVALGVALGIRPRTRRTEGNTEGAWLRAYVGPDFAEATR